MPPLTCWKGGGAVFFVVLIFALIMFKVLFELCLLVGGLVYRADNVSRRALIVLMLLTCAVMALNMRLW